MYSQKGQDRISHFAYKTFNPQQFDATIIAMCTTPVLHFGWESTTALRTICNYQWNQQGTLLKAAWVVRPPPARSLVRRQGLAMCLPSAVRGWPRTAEGWSRALPRASCVPPGAGREPSRAPLAGAGRAPVGAGRAPP
jgi:hypothetical protein